MPEALPPGRRNPRGNRHGIQPATTSPSATSTPVGPLSPPRRDTGPRPADPRLWVHQTRRRTRGLDHRASPYYTSTSSSAASCTRSTATPTSPTIELAGRVWSASRARAPRCRAEGVRSSSNSNESSPRVGAQIATSSCNADAGQGGQARLAADRVRSPTMFFWTR